MNSGGRIVGENTDERGSLASLRGVVDPKGLRAILVGANEVARGVAVELALADAGATTVVSRHTARGMALAEFVASRTGAARRSRRDALLALVAPCPTLGPVVQTARLSPPLPVIVVLRTRGRCSLDRACAGRPR